MGKGMNMIKSEIYQRIYALAALIPPGKVATYGQLAFLAGVPRGGRLAGQAMANAPEGKHIPCHRVVSSTGSLAPVFVQQRSLLEAEGVTFLKSGRVDMRHHLWNPGESAKSGGPRS